MGKKFKSVIELKNYYEQSKTWWEKFILNPKMNWLRWIVYNLSDVPKDMYNEIKWFIQRGRRGWSDRDSWSIDWWLSEIMPSILMRLKNNKQGIPSSCFSSSKSRLKKNDEPTKAEWKRAEKRWNKILRSIIDMFKTSKWMLEDHWIYCKTKDYYKKENKDLRNRMAQLDFTYIMSYKECKLYEEGWKNFQTYFHDLWD